MAQPPSLTTLPTELHLKLFETIPNLSDLISLLHSSPHFAALFRRYHRSILTHTVLPRLNPQDPDAVAGALQAACSGGTFHCRLPAPAFPPPASLASQQVGEFWFLPPKHNIWHADFAGDPLAILPVLRDLERETRNFRRMISAHRQGHGRKLPLPVPRAKQQSLTWALQTQTLRCANTRSVRWHGPTAASQRERAETVLNASFLQFWDGLGVKQQRVLVAAGKTAGECARRVRALLVLPPPGGLVFRMCLGLAYDAMRVAGHGGERDWVQAAVDRAERQTPGRIGLSERQQYRLHGREMRRQGAGDQPSNMQLAAGASPSRVDRIRANLGSYLDKFSPLTSSGALDSIGEFYGFQAQFLNPKASALEKHLRLIAGINLRTAVSDLRVREDLEDIIPDMTGCMNAAVRKWDRTRRVERKYGVALRQELKVSPVLYGPLREFDGRVAASPSRDVVSASRRLETATPLIRQAGDPAA